MYKAMMTCHSLNMVDHAVVGHFVDKEMFHAVKAKISHLDAPFNFGTHRLPLAARITKDDKEFLILKRFDFDPQIQRASVLFAVPNGQGYQVCASIKGSPEAMLEKCRKESVPSDYVEKYKYYSSRGYYVLAIALRNLDKEYPIANLTTAVIQNVERADIENQYTFVGFLLFQSPIKTESFGTIDELTFASIKSKIITGDAALTAIHVARELKLADRIILIDTADLVKGEGVKLQILSPERNDTLALLSPPRTLEDLVSQSHLIEQTYKIAITCSALNYIIENYDKSLSRWIIKTGLIFARAKPKDKTLILETLIRMGYYTAMVGDGTNDCGALKAAHVGVALSDTEASIVAPFSSASKTVADVPKLLREGRCALETSFIAFKYMAVYPVIQLVASIIAYYYESQLGPNQYLFDDIAIVFGFATTMLYNGPIPFLTKNVPAKSLFTKTVLASLIGQIAICVGFAAVNLVYLLNQSWYCDSVTAQSQLDDEFLPIDPSAPFEKTYPCYYVDPSRDVSFGTLIATYEGTIPWMFGHFQFVGTVLAYCLCSQFRVPFWKNIYFTGLIVLVCLLL